MMIHTANLVMTNSCYSQREGTFVKMNKKNEQTFSVVDLFKKTVFALVGAILIILPISLLVGLYFFGFAGLFSILGVQFDSFHTLLLFVLAYFLLALVMDVFSVMLYELISSFVSGEQQLFITRMIFDCAFSWLALYTVDEFMSTITIPLSIEIIAVLLVFFVEEAFTNKKTRKTADCSC